MNLKVKCHGQRCSLSKLLLLSRIRGFKQAGTSGEKKNAFPLRRRIGKDTELSRRESPSRAGADRATPLEVSGRRCGTLRGQGGCHPSSACSLWHPLGTLSSALRPTCAFPRTRQPSADSGIRNPDGPHLCGYVLMSWESTNRNKSFRATAVIHKSNKIKQRVV